MRKKILMLLCLLFVVVQINALDRYNYYRRYQQSRSIRRAGAFISDRVYDVFLEFALSPKQYYLDMASRSTRMQKLKKIKEAGEIKSAQRQQNTSLLARCQTLMKKELDELKEIKMTLRRQQQRTFSQVNSTNLNQQRHISTYSTLAYERCLRKAIEPMNRARKNMMNMPNSKQAEQAYYLVRSKSITELKSCSKLKP